MLFDSRVEDVRLTTQMFVWCVSDVWTKPDQKCWKMAAQLEIELDGLCLCLSDPGKPDSVRARDIINNIDNICQHDVSEKDIGEYYRKLACVTGDILLTCKKWLNNNMDFAI